MILAAPVASPSAVPTAFSGLYMEKLATFVRLYLPVFVTRSALRKAHRGFGAIITLLAVTGMTHRQAYKDIFAITVVKTLAAFFALAVFFTRVSYRPQLNHVNDREDRK